MTLYHFNLFGGDCFGPVAKLEREGKKNETLLVNNTFFKRENIEKLTKKKKCSSLKAFGPKVEYGGSFGLALCC